MPLTIEGLKQAVGYWRGTDWPQDFHNAFYEYELAAVQPHGLFNQDWWDRFVRILSSWRATGLAAARS